jgi:hypothetical protein
MFLLPKNKAPQRLGNEQLARQIAGLLLAVQTRIAAKFNCWINDHPKATQKRILWVFCALFGLALAVSCRNAFNGLTLADKKFYQPTYIGQPSFRTGPDRLQHKPGDSLILKK